MLTEEHAKEGLSRAYVQAVGAKAQVLVSINDRSHDYGMDGSFHDVSILNGKRVESGTKIDFQLKATSIDVVRDEHVQFSVDADLMNLLASRAKTPYSTRAILIVLCLPAQSEEWLELSEKELILRKCCYWTSISSFTSNLYSATIKIPRSQVLMPETVRELLGKISQGQPV